MLKQVQHDGERERRFREPYRPGIVYARSTFKDRHASAAPPRPLADARPGFREFVVLIAGLMSLNALAIDAMVPALPAIGEALNVADENSRQLVVSLYVLGFGLTQIIYGPLSDRFGRKPVLIVSLVLYVAFALACWAAPSFTLLLAARMAQGGAAASTRVLVVSIVRDRFEGPQMARIMSLAFLVFLLIPMLAPVFGQLDPAGRLVAGHLLRPGAGRSDHAAVDGDPAARDPCIRNIGGRSTRGRSGTGPGRL